MATTTIVITYTAGAAPKNDAVTSFTVDGTAYGSLTAAQIQASLFRMDQAVRNAMFDKATTLGPTGIVNP